MIACLNRLVLATCLCIAVPFAARAADGGALYEFAIPAEPLSVALGEYCRVTERQILFTEELTRGVNAAALRGRYNADDALRTLLAGSNLSVQTTAAGVLVLQRDGGARRTPATSAAESETTELERVVVTSNKRDQKLQDVPASITAETGTALERRGATQLADIIQTTAGLTNAGSGGGNSTDLTIRGVTTGGLGLKQSTVALLFDDIPVDPALLSQSATNLRTVDVERVEVLRGPQGTLFGSGSLSGAIRFITNKPDLNAWTASGELTGAKTRDGASTGFGNVVLNAPIVPGTLGVRAVGYDFYEGGWVDNIRTNQDNVNANRTKGGRVEFEGRPADRLTVTLTGAYQDSHDLGAGESLYVQPAGSSSNDQVTNLRKSTDLDVVSKIVNLGVRYDLPSVSLFSSSTVIRRDTLQLDDSGFYNDYLALAFGVPPLFGASAPATNQNHQRIFTQEIRASSRGEGPWKWTLGAFYLNASLDGGQVIDSPTLRQITGTGTLADLTSSGRQAESSIFGETTYTLANQWDLTAGLRVSHTDIKSSTDSRGVLFTGTLDPRVIVNTSIKQSDTTEDPRFSVAYRFNPDLTVYATAARGHRVGGPNLTAGLGGPGIPTSYNADSLWNYETGVKSRLFGGRLQVSAAAYYIDWSDIQAALVANSVNYTGNAGSAGIYGLEVEAVAKPLAWLEVGGSGSLSHSALTKDVPNLTRVTGVVGVASGDALPGAPNFKLSAFTQATTSILDHTAYARITDNYIGSEYTDFGHRGTRYGAFNTVDVRAGVFVRPFEIAVFIDNLTDSGGARAASDPLLVGPIVASDQVAYRIRPRTAGLTLRGYF